MGERVSEFLAKHAFQAFFFIVSLIGTLVTLHTFGIALPWLISASLGVTVLFLFANVLFLLRPKEREDIGVLLFHLILPTDGIKPFYNLMIDSASKALEQLADRNWLLVPRIPTTAFDKLDIWQKFDGVGALKRITGGIILLADDPDENYERIVAGLEETSIPTVMIDVYFNPRGYDERSRARMPCFVGGDELEGGKIAAQILFERIQSRCSETEGTPKIIVIRGGDTAWESQRIASFKKTLSGKLKCDFIETEYLFYHRDDAFDTIYRLFSGMSDADLALCSGIFAANDDMAIGARNAIRELAKASMRELNVSIVGYDGTPEMLKMIDRHDDYIVGTIDVKIQDQAKQAVYVMKNLVEGIQPKQKIHLIKPKGYTRI